MQVETKNELRSESMNRKPTPANIVGFLTAGLISTVVAAVTVFAMNLIFGMDFLDYVLFLVAFLFWIAIVMIWELKQPRGIWGNKYVKFMVPLILFFLLNGFFIGYAHDRLYGLNNPLFHIADISYTHEYGVGYSFHAKIWNEGKEGTEYVYCFVTKGDLTIVSKYQQVYLNRNEEAVIHFYFSEYEVGNDWKEYRIKIAHERVAS